MKKSPIFTPKITLLLTCCIHFQPFIYIYEERRGFTGGSDSKESACNAGDLGLIRGLGRSLGEGHGNPLQYSCLGNSMDIQSEMAEVTEYIHLHSNLG